MTPETRDPVLRTPGLGDTQRLLLERLKREGAQSLADLEEVFDLARETLRQHLNALEARGLVRRAGRRRSGPGRPEVLYGLAPGGEELFPRREGEVLKELALFLQERDREDLLEAFFEERARRVRSRARRRLAGLEGRERMEEVAAILSEQGYMAEVVEGPEGEPRLRLSHCPIKDLVSASRLPCRTELEWVEEALEAPLLRRAWMPEGDHTCTYTSET